MSNTYNPPGNIYNQFRKILSYSNINDIPKDFSIRKRFDEPTYFSFRLVFSYNNDENYNFANNQASYDVMPHPLFYPAKVTGKNTGLGGQIANQENLVIEDFITYSAIKYLQDANEPVRAAMLEEFIDKFRELENNYQYYFQAIDGVTEIIKIDPTKGQRVLSDKKIIVTCLEGLDLRMSYLMNLYRKIVWDDVYQRWILPDMMRYFTLKIYLSEFRTFHIPKINGTANAYGTFEPAGNINREKTPLILTILDDILPTWEITCEMCEFDISDINFDHLTNLTVNNDPIQGALKFGIKVGNIKETQIYPVFKYRFLNDRRLNAVNRTKEEELNVVRGEENSNITNIYPATLQIAQNRDGNVSKTHVSGTPFVERENKDTTKDIALTADVIFNTKTGKLEKLDFDAAQPETWIGNAIDTGKAFVTNIVKKIIDKGKITPIPELGFSFTEITTALETKDIVGALGLVRKSMTTVASEHVMPSELLSQEIIDGTFRQFLVTLTQSKATDNDTIMLQEAANVALSDRGIWEKIKDYSLATDLVSQGEVNIKKNLQGADQYKTNVKQQSSKTAKLQDAALPKVVPNAVSGTINQEPNLVTGKASSNLSNTMENGGLERGIAPSSNLTEQVISGGELKMGKASSNLSNDVETGGLNRGAVPSSNLQGNVQPDAIDRNVLPSSSLSDNFVTGGPVRGDAPSSRLPGNTSQEPFTEDVAPSSHLSDNAEGGMKQVKSSGLLSDLQQSSNTIPTEKPSNRISSLDPTGAMKEVNAKVNIPLESESGIKQTAPSSKLSTLESESGIKQTAPSSKLSTLETTQIIKGNTPGVKTRTIEVGNIIEATPSSILSKQLTTELEQPPVSKATTSKLEQTGSLDGTAVSKATTQELFSK